MKDSGSIEYETRELKKTIYQQRDVILGKSGLRLDGDCTAIEDLFSEVAGRTRMGGAPSFVQIFKAFQEMLLTWHQIFGRWFDYPSS